MHTRLNHVLAGCAVFLTGLLAVQAYDRMSKEPSDHVSQEPKVRLVASWRHNPQNVTEAANLATQIVRAKVVSIERGRDIVTRAAGEPGGVDRIPVEVVTLETEGAYKGAAPRTVQVFFTGRTVLPDKGNPPAMPADRKHGNEQIRPGRKVTPPASERLAHSVFIEDDPPYRRGATYVLFLANGPDVTTARGVVKTMSVVAPQARIAITADRKLAPVSGRGFGAQLNGQGLAVLEGQLPRFTPRTR